MKNTLWFNKGLRSVSNFVADMRAAQRPEDNFRFVCAHTSNSFPAITVADHFELEPDEAEGYVDWALGFVQRQGVKVFFPTKHSHAVTEHAARFEACGRTRDVRCERIRHVP